MYGSRAQGSACESKGRIGFSFAFDPTLGATNARNESRADPPAGARGAALHLLPGEPPLPPESYGGAAIAMSAPHATAVESVR
eukprot:1191203-Prorocentrum_minimum.AAC.1